MRWGGGSDFSVTPYAARYGPWASVTRETLNGTYGRTPFGLDEAVDVRTALKSYTIWAAHTMFLDDRVGSIEVGKDADLAIFNGHPFSPYARVEMTLIEGQVFFDRERDLKSRVPWKEEFEAEPEQRPAGAPSAEVRQ